LETNDRLKADQTYPVDDLRVLDQQVPWVVVGNGSTYHLPDPQAAADGEAVHHRLQKLVWCTTRPWIQRRLFVLC